MPGGGSKPGLGDSGERSLSLRESRRDERGLSLRESRRDERSLSLRAGPAAGEGAEETIGNADDDGGPEGVIVGPEMILPAEMWIKILGHLGLISPDALFRAREVSKSFDAWVKMSRPTFSFSQSYPPTRRGDKGMLFLYRALQMLNLELVRGLETIPHGPLFQAMRSDSVGLAEALIETAARLKNGKLKGRPANELQLAVYEPILEVLLSPDGYSIMLLEAVKALPRPRENRRRGQAHYGGVVLYLIEKGADVNYHGEDRGKTALHYAFDYADLTRLLIEKGADVNAVDDDGATPLHQIRRLSVAKVLIESGADVNARDDSGATPLIVYVESYPGLDFSLDRIIEFLMSHDADVNAADGGGWTALCVAINAGELDTASALLKFEADPNAGNGRAVFARLFNMNTYDDAYASFVEEMFEKGADLNDDVKNFLLFAVAELRCVETAKVLLDAGANVNDERVDIPFLPNDDLRKTPLLAAYEGNLRVSRPPLPMLKLLIERGANKAYHNSKGQGIFELAATRRSGSVLGRWLTDSQGLRLSVSHLPVMGYGVRLLQEAGLDINASVAGSTPLSHVVQRYREELATGSVEDVLEYTEAIQVLVANGAIPFASDGRGPSAMDAAEGDDLIVPLLLEGRDAHVLGGDGTGADETGRWV